MFRAWILAILLGVIALAPIFWMVYYKTSTPEDQFVATVQFVTAETTSLEPGAVVGVRACNVLDGYRFELYLEGGTWVIAHLTHAAKEEATPIVIDLLKTATAPAPTVKLLRKVGNVWIVDFNLTTEHQTMNLLEHLRKKDLLL